MNSEKYSYNEKLDDAAHAIAEDDRELVRACLESVMEQMSDRADFWLLQAWASESLQGTGSALTRAIEIDPENQIALSGLSWIRGIQELARRQLEAKQEAERIRAEEEARRQAEEEARIKAEQERLRAEEEARALAEEEAAKEAEEESRRIAEMKRFRAEEAARAQAEEEARLKADEEKARAEEAARLEQEAETQAELDKSQDEQCEQSVAVESQLHETVETLAGDVREQVQSGHDDSADSSPTDGTKPMILAVDDSPTIRKLVALALNQQGYEVLTAEDGIEALSIIAERMPDLILSDINMPKLGGYKLCSFVKKHDRTKHIPVIMLSGKDGVFDKMRGKMNGCDAFIAKPFESKDLVEMVREHLAGTRSCESEMPSA